MNNLLAVLVGVVLVIGSGQTLEVLNKQDLLHYLGRMLQDDKVNQDLHENEVKRGHETFTDDELRKIIQLISELRPLICHDDQKQCKKKGEHCAWKAECCNKSAHCYGWVCSK